MYYLGLDVGSSSVKAAIVDAKSGKSILSVHEPKNEMGITVSYTHLTLPTI